MFFWHTKKYDSMITGTHKQSYFMQFYYEQKEGEKKQSMEDQMA